MGEGGRFDELSRAAATGMPRRRLLKLAVTGIVGGAAAAVVGPRRLAEAICTGTPCGTDCCNPSTQTCVNNTTCCDNGQVCGSTCCRQSLVCLNASTSQCGCPAGGSTCGKFCCKPGDTCSFASGGCCCPSGSTPCGESCCAPGVACLNSKRRASICGCAAGATPCGSGTNLTCCPAGTACGSSGCTPASNNYVSGYCSGLASDVHVKANITAVIWPA